MSSEWTQTTLGTLAAAHGAEIKTGPFGTKLKASEYTTHGVPLISVREIQLGNIVVDAHTPRVATAVQQRMPEYLLVKGDIVLARKGGIERSAWVSEVQAGYFMGSDALRIRLPPTIESRFVAYQIRSKAMQEWLLRHSTGSTMASLSGRVLALMPLTLPPLAEQRRIAALLGALDDRIELNRSMSRTLEEMAQALFKSWFSDFDGRDDLTQQVQALMDAGSLVVGDGYRAKRSELASEGLPFARAGNIDNGFKFEGAELLGNASTLKAREKVSRPGDVVFTAKGTVGRFAFVSESTPPFVYAPQLCFWRSTDPQQLDPVFLLHWMLSPAFLQQVAMVKGQTDMAEYVSLRDQRRMTITLPDAREQAKIVAVLRPIRARLAVCTDASRTLAELRDLLLPKLISGELRIPEAEALLS